MQLCMFANLVFNVWEDINCHVCDHVWDFWMHVWEDINCHLCDHVWKFWMHVWEFLGCVFGHLGDHVWNFWMHVLDSFFDHVYVMHVWEDACLECTL